MKIDNKNYFWFIGIVMNMKKNIELAVLKLKLNLVKIGIKIKYIFLLPVIGLKLSFPHFELFV